MQNTSFNIDQIVGVDIGGSHIAAALVEHDQIVNGSYCEQKLDSSANAENILDIWISTIRNVISFSKADHPAISVAMPGPFDYVNGISLITGMQKYEALYGLDIRTFFSDKLNIPKDKIQFSNDAKSFILGEAIGGVAKGYTNIIGITLGTGVGSATCKHLVATDMNKGSAPFKDGIVEEYLSTRWFVSRYMELTGMKIPDVKTICELNESNLYRNQLFHEFSINLSMFLDDFVQEERPDIVVIGGGIAKASSEFLPYVHHKLRSKFPNLAIRCTSLWDNAALIGASAAFQIPQTKLIS